MPQMQVSKLLGTKRTNTKKCTNEWLRYGPTYFIHKMLTACIINRIYKHNVLAEEQNSLRIKHPLNVNNQYSALAGLASDNESFNETLWALWLCKLFIRGQRSRSSMCYEQRVCWCLDWMQAADKFSQHICCVFGIIKYVVWNRTRKGPKHAHRYNKNHTKSSTFTTTLPRSEGKK